jgi:flagellin-like hook-associated protein FlgL
VTFRELAISEQTTIARSRIEEAGLQTENASLAKSQVLQQTRAVMMAQAGAWLQLVG